MVSYLILTPPGAAADDERARFVADGFSWPAFFFPALWLIVKRAWLLGIPVAVLQILLISFSTLPGGFVPALLMHLALSLLVTLEGPLVIASLLSAKDWTLRRIVTARDLATAEQIYYSTAAVHPQNTTPSQPVEWSRTRRTENSTGPDFFESYGER